MDRSESEVDVTFEETSSRVWEGVVAGPERQIDRTMALVEGTLWVMEVLKEDGQPESVAVYWYPGEVMPEEMSVGEFAQARHRSDPAEQLGEEFEQTVERYREMDERMEEGLEVGYRSGDQPE